MSHGLSFPCGFYPTAQNWHHLQCNPIPFRNFFLWWFEILPILPQFINPGAPQTQGFHLIFNFGTDTFLSFSSPKLGKELRKSSQENFTTIFLKLHMSRFKNKYIYIFFRNSNNSELTWFLIMLLVTVGGPNIFFGGKKKRKKEEKKPQIPPIYLWWSGSVLERIRSVSFIKLHFIRMNVLLQPKYIAAHHHHLSWLSKSRSMYNASCHCISNHNAQSMEVQVTTKDKADVPKQRS